MVARGCAGAIAGQGRTGQAVCIAEIRQGRADLEAVAAARKGLMHRTVRKAGVFVVPKGPAPSPLKPARAPCKTRALLSAQMAELVDALVSGTSAARRGGSSPLLGTSLFLFSFLETGA